MSRILVDFPERDLVKLKNYARNHGSRAALIRKIVENWLDQQGGDDDQAFGVLKDHPVDALDYQRKCREDW